MTHRARLERDVSGGTDGWNQDDPPDFQPLKTVPCRAWSKRRRVVRDDGKEALIEDLRALFPADADIRTGDRISAITDRRGRVIFAGPLAVDPVVDQGANIRHREAMLTRHV